MSLILIDYDNEPPPRREANERISDVCGSPSETRCSPTMLANILAVREEWEAAGARVERRQVGNVEKLLQSARPSLAPIKGR